MSSSDEPSIKTAQFAFSAQSSDAAEPFVDNYLDTPARNNDVLELNLVHMVTDLFHEFTDGYYTTESNWTDSAPPLMAEGRFNPDTHETSLHFWPRRYVSPDTGLDTEQADLRITEELRGFMAQLQESVIVHDVMPEKDMQHLDVLYDGQPQIEFVIAAKTPYALIDLIAYYMKDHNLVCADHAETVYMKPSKFHDKRPAYPNFGLGTERLRESLPFAALSVHFSEEAAMLSGERFKERDPLLFSIQYATELARNAMQKTPPELRLDDDRVSNALRCH